MRNDRGGQRHGPYRFYSLWFHERPAHYWPEIALRLSAGERVEDYVCGHGKAREITREAYYEFPSGVRHTRQPRQTPPPKAMELQ